MRMYCSMYTCTLCNSTIVNIKGRARDISDPPYLSYQEYRCKIVQIPWFPNGSVTLHASVA